MNRSFLGRICCRSAYLIRSVKKKKKKPKRSSLFFILCRNYNFGGNLSFYQLKYCKSPFVWVMINWDRINRIVIYCTFCWKFPKRTFKYTHEEKETIKTIWLLSSAWNNLFESADVVSHVRRSKYQWWNIGISMWFCIFYRKFCRWFLFVLVWTFWTFVKWNGKGSKWYIYIDRARNDSK